MWERLSSRDSIFDSTGNRGWKAAPTASKYENLAVILRHSCDLRLSKGQSKANTTNRHLSFNNIHLISLAELHQNSAGGFGMQKGDLSATGTFSGFLVNQPNPLFLELL